MTIDFNCPHCSKILKTSDDKAGRQAKCPGCGEIITVPLAPTDPRFDDTLIDSAGAANGTELPNSVDPDERKSCPMCGEQIMAAAVRCRFCGEVLVSSKGQSRKRGIGTVVRPFPPGDVISETWRIFTEHMGMLLGAYWLMYFLDAVAISIAAIPIAFAGSRFEEGDQVGGIVAGGIGAVLSILATVFVTYLAAGFLVIQIKVAREEPAELSDLFSGKRFTFRMILTTVVVGLIVALGILACYVPGVILMLMFFPYAHALIDEDLPGIEALNRAKKLSQGNKWSLLIIVLVGSAFGILGMLACYIGLIFTIPLTFLLNAVAYDRMTCQAPIKASD